VLHTGARIVWSRWKHYAELAERLVAETDLKIVLFADDPATKAKLSPELLASGRLIVLERQLPFDDFDALLSFAAIYVGNDSGPKHLASLRGTPTVSIHSSRINWSEWGQEHSGVIISRKMPCAGCHIYHDPEECGKDYACMDIKLGEVYEAVRRYV
jgi:ADP-heptose:LPS heptosyltransferase